jgi:SET domain-containing protein
MTDEHKRKFRIGRPGVGLGLGLYAREPFKTGEFVMEYTGNRIPTKEADILETRYLFEIDKDWTIDGSPRSNTARYMNHACYPNCETDIVNGKILITAVRDIEPGEELTFDYGEEYFDEFIRPVGCKCADCASLGPTGSKRAIKSSR